MSVEQIANLIKKSNHTFVLTGAGMSTESGLPDYRGTNGMWKNHKCAQLMTPKGMLEHPEDYTEFNRSRVQGNLEHGPNAGHKALAEIQRALPGKFYLATQNVDGYHVQAGSPQVNELHGRLLNLHCFACLKPVSPEEYLAENGQHCKDCTHLVRPGVVMFTEDLPPSLAEAQKAAERSDLVIACGTTLQVYPANHLFLKGDAYRVIINQGETWLDGNANLKVELPLAAAWSQILEHLQK